MVWYGVVRYWMVSHGTLLYCHAVTVVVVVVVEMTTILSHKTVVMMFAHEFSLGLGVKFVFVAACSAA